MELESYRRELLAYCRHLLWKKEDLEDAVQEVLVQALRARFPGGDLKRWLFRVATNTVYNLNRRHRDRPVPVDPPAEAQLELEETYEAILRDPRAIPTSLVDAGLQDLNDSERAVLLLRSICDFKYGEIAATLDVPIGTVMGTLSRARAKMRKAMAERSHAM